MPELGSTAAADPIPVEDLGPIDVLDTTDAESPSLRGSSCPECQQIAFPPRHSCSRCNHSPQDKVSLSREGTLYAFSTVHVSSAEAVPYILGFVDLAGDIRVLSKLFGSADDFAIGDLVVFAVDDGDWGFEIAERRTVSRG